MGNSLICGDRVISKVTFDWPHKVNAGDEAQVLFPIPGTTKYMVRFESGQQAQMDRKDLDMKREDLDAKK